MRYRLQTSCFFAHESFKRETKKEHGEVKKYIK